MRYILSLVLILFAYECYAGTAYYVNPNAASARNLPAASGYGLSPTDSPFLTPSYALSQIAGASKTDHDTMFIYANGDSYPDAIQMNTKYIDIVGIDYSGESCVVSCSVVRGWFYRPSDVQHYVIENIIFDGKTTGDGQLFYFGDAMSNPPATFRNCMFTNVPQGKASEGYGGFIHHQPDADGVQHKMLFENCVISNVWSLISIRNTVSGRNAAAQFTNCSFQNDSYIANISEGAFSPYPNILYFYDCIIDCDSWIVVDKDYDAASAYTIVTSYSDSLTPNSSGISNSSNYPTRPINVTFSHTALMQTPVSWKYNITDAKYPYGYLADATTSPITDSSSIGGLVGVLWGWSAPYAPQVTGTLRYVNPFCSVYRRLLWGTR